MRDHAPGGPGPRLAAVVPGRQLFGLSPERGEGLLGMHQVGQVGRVPFQVLTPEPEPQVTGEGAGAVARPAGSRGSLGSSSESSTPIDSSLSWVRTCG